METKKSYRSIQQKVYQLPFSREFLSKHRPSTGKRSFTGKRPFTAKQRNRIPSPITESRRSLQNQRMNSEKVLTTRQLIATPRKRHKKLSLGQPPVSIPDATKQQRQSAYGVYNCFNNLAILQGFTQSQSQVPINTLLKKFTPSDLDGTQKPVVMSQGVQSNFSQKNRMKIVIPK